MAKLPDEMVSPYNWQFWARPKQIQPSGAWSIWLILAGRGFGKTRTGAETVRQWAQSGAYSRIALVGETVADVRDVMIEGPDGILARSPKGERPHYEPSKRRLTWPNGVIGITYSGVDPDQLRGPQHAAAWVDELAKFHLAQETWDNLMMGLRMGEQPRCIVTTTPRPISLVRELVRRSNDGTGEIVITRGSTYENLQNLAPTFRRQVIERYEGTTLGRQELEAEILDEMPGSLWSRAQIEASRRYDHSLVRIGIGVDPSISADGSGDECGICVVGIDASSPVHGWVLEDCSLRGSPREWAAAVEKAYRKWGANVVVAEGNQGGAMVKEVLRSVEASMPVVTVWASRGKVARAEPVAALYEQGRVHHAGVFPLLEDEMVLWLPGMASPNRLDALVWVLSELMVQGGGETSASVF